MWEQLVQFLDKNSLASGGLLLMVFGSILATLRGVPLHVWRWTRNKFLVTMEIPQHDQAFQWITKFLTNHPNFQHGRHSILNSLWNSAHSHDLFLSPAVGRHFLFHNGWPIWFERRREKVEFAWPSAHYDTFVFQTFGRNKKRLIKMIEDARIVGESIGEGCVKSYINSGSDWHYRVLRGTKTKNDVILDGNLMDDIIGDAKQFMDGKEWYKNKGIPYRRGYLLFGPPGCGKSSLILALAGELNCPIYFLSLADKSVSDKDLYMLVSNLRPSSLLVIEDIDAVFKTRVNSETEEKEKKEQPISNVSMSGLLNALDGILSGEGRLLIMTTNHPEKLDPALKRPGRTDREICLDKATNDQFNRLFDNFFGIFDGSGVVKSKYVDKSMSPAEIQERLLKNKDNPKNVL